MIEMFGDWSFDDENSVYNRRKPKINDMNDIPCFNELSQRCFL